MINEGKIIETDLLIHDKHIDHIGSERQNGNIHEINAEGLYLMPGIIDDQVHFREPGLTHKADIASESRAGIAGGVTSFMEMPNTKPVASTIELLEDKYKVASQTAWANYSFYLGGTEHNQEEVKRINPQNICGLKIFMGSSTGDLLVDDDAALERLFAVSPVLIATHCEDETMFRNKLEEYKIRFADQIPAKAHEFIRSAEGCYKSSSKAVALALRTNARLHILHITTEKEISLFKNDTPLHQKQITSEVCVHHLYFDHHDYSDHGNKIKCNPSIKRPEDKAALLQGYLEGRLDVIATDHAPHLLSEKIGSYLLAASGLPLIQHSLNMMLDFYHQQKIDLGQIVHGMCHAPASCFQIANRGYLREGYFADLVLFDPDERILIRQEDAYYKCAWTPLEGAQLFGKVYSTFVNGYQIYQDGRFNEFKAGERLMFDR